MIDYSKELREQLLEMKKLLANAKKRQKNHEGLPKGALRVTTSQGVPQYYFKEQGKEKATYVHAKDRAIVYKLIQRDYDLSVLRALEEDCKSMDAFLNKYHPKHLDEIYEKLCIGRKKYVTPIMPSDEEFTNTWLAEIQGEKNPFPESGKYETEQGEKVRSKSEKILADTFYKMKIPYRYEPEVLLTGHKAVYPDFACLNVRKRKTIYWEHLGLLNADDYALKNYMKLESYEKNGIFLGDSLIISMETPEMPLDIALIRKKIEKFLI